MVRIEHFYYNSKDEQTKIHAMSWIPDGHIRGILQISHGMVEHIERYSEFALYLADYGILVTGNDHLGHGSSIKDEQHFGYFSDQNGNANVINDIHQLRVNTQKRYPDAPYFILGHSMGSFLVRQYLCYYGAGLAGAIIMGTGSQPKYMIRAGMGFAHLTAFFKGWKHRSKALDNMAYGGYNNKIKNKRTDSDWLSSDKVMVDQYREDPRCRFTFTLNGYYNMFQGMLSAMDHRNIQKMPKDLPLLLVGGQEDPVGSYGTAVKAVAAIYKKAGIKNVSDKLYENDRHEILNEVDRMDVYYDLYEWMDKLIKP